MTTTQSVTSIPIPTAAPVSAALAPATAPLQIELRFDLDVSTAEAFDILAFRLPEWFGAIHKVTYDNTASQNGPETVGACSSRVCAMGRKHLVEEIVWFAPGKGYSYRADMGRSSMKMPISEHLGTLEIEANGKRSRVIWRQYFRAPVWPFGVLVRWYMRERMMRPALRVMFRKYGGRPAA